MPEADLPLQEPSEKDLTFADPSVVNSTNIKTSTDNEVVGQTKKSNTSIDTLPELDSLLKVALKELQASRQKLEIEVKDMEKRKSQLEKEIKSSFSGQSDAIARRVKGFQDYLTGALQDLSQSAEQLELVVQPVVLQPSPLDASQATKTSTNIESIPAIADTFKPDEYLIRECFDQFLGQPDFYADAWKLRRSLEQKDVGLLEDWFFSMGGRGAQPSRGSRAKNILVSAGLISILGELYGDRFQTLVLASQPERLGEWRRGLQDALGLSREDFGPNSGIVLFERADGLIERADRLEARNEVPLIIIDAAQENIEIPILQFPIWLAFAAAAEEIYAEEDEMI